MFLVKDKDNSGVLVVYVQQAAAAKTIGILVKLSNQIAELFLSVRLIYLIYNLSKKFD